MDLSGKTYVVMGVASKSIAWGAARALDKMVQPCLYLGEDSAKS